MYVSHLWVLIFLFLKLEESKNMLCVRRNGMSKQGNAGYKQLKCAREMKHAIKFFVKLQNNTKKIFNAGLRSSSSILGTG